MADEQLQLPLDLPSPAEQLDAVRQSNSKKYLSLQTSGLRPDPLTVMLFRIESILSLLSSEDRVSADLVFEKLMSEFLDKCLADANQQLLRPTTAGSGGLFLPGR